MCIGAIQMSANVRELIFVMKKFNIVIEYASSLERWNFTKLPRRLLYDFLLCDVVIFKLDAINQDMLNGTIIGLKNGVSWT